MSGAINTTFQDIRDIQLCVLIDNDRLAFHRDSFRCHRVAESIAQAFNDRLDKARHPAPHRFLEPRPVFICLLRVSRSLVTGMTHALPFLSS
jgi:hypothetical protein